MSGFESELKRIDAVVTKLCKFALLGKKIEVKGEENFVRTGPNIIVGNHIGTYKDVATLFRVVPRQIFFMANKEIFSKDQFNLLIRNHLQRHLKNFGLFLNLMFHPLKSLFVQFIASNIAKAGTIPVDFQNGRRETRKTIQDYLRKERSIIVLQGRGRVGPKDKNPYVSRFRRGASVIAHQLYEEDRLPVPVTPLALFGTQVPFLVPSRVMVNVGKPMYVTQYLVDGAQHSVERFRAALENRVKTLLFELIRA